MIDKKQYLLTRLDEIGRALAEREHTLALIGLGSVGIELERLDDFSDLDFFVIVEEGYKDAFIENLEWLSSICPIAYQYRNTKDGYKLLFDDGVFCEFALFEGPELPDIPFARGRIVWKRPYVDESMAIPQYQGAAAEAKPVEWLVGEVLTNLYVGLSRYRRGEKLWAARFIQHFAVDRLLELVELIADEVPVQKDIFANERRFEQRFPGLANELPGFMQGYEHSRESAGEILDYLERRFEVNPAMARAIRGLI